MISTSGGVRSIRRRSSGDVSPVRTATLGAGSSTPAAAGGRADAGERRAQVALDVVVERLERRDVEHAQALARLRHEAVEEPQERGQRLARSRGRAHEHVLARRDRRPALRLRGRRRAERARRTSGVRAARTRRARQRWRWTSPPHHTTNAAGAGQRSSRSNESRPLAVSTIAAASVTRAAMHAVARRARPLARAQQPADRTRRPARPPRATPTDPDTWPRTAAARRPRRRCSARCEPAPRSPPG